LAKAQPQAEPVGYDPNLVGVALAFIPCPACDAPIALDLSVEALPQRLTCAVCGSLLER